MSGWQKSIDIFRSVHFSEFCCIQRAIILALLYILIKYIHNTLEPNTLEKKSLYNIFQSCNKTMHIIWQMTLEYCDHNRLYNPINICFFDSCKINYNLKIVEIFKRFNGRRRPIRTLIFCLINLLIQRTQMNVKRLNYAINLNQPMFHIYCIKMSISDT